jgi:hypothetical protein
MKAPKWFNEMYPDLGKELRWISILETPPPTYTIVGLSYNYGKSTSAGYFDPDGYKVLKIYGVNNADDTTVTHWMPLPEAPEPRV